MGGVVQNFHKNLDYIHGCFLIERIGIVHFCLGAKAKSYSLAKQYYRRKYGDPPGEVFVNQKHQSPFGLLYNIFTS